MASNVGPLELKKIELEIRELERSPWVKPSVLIPILATLATLVLSQYLGIFEVERKRVELSYREALIEKAEVRRDLEKLNSERVLLNNQQTSLIHDRNALQQTVADLRGKVSELQKQETIARQAASRANTELAVTKQTLARPHVVIGGQTDPEKSIAVLHAANRGLGPAKITWTKVYVDNHKVSSSHIGGALAKALDILDLDHKWVRWEFRGSIIRPGEVVRIIGVDQRQFTETRARLFDAAIDRLGIEICYCSYFGKCDVAVYKRSGDAVECLPQEAQPIIAPDLAHKAAQGR